MSPPFNYNKFTHLPLRVQSLLKTRVESSGDFSQLKTLHESDDLNTYHKQTDSFILQTTPEKAWQIYTSQRPEELWQGPMVHYLFAYSENENKFYYPGDEDIPSFQAGMLFYCWLNIMGPRLIIGLKLMKLDQKAKILEIAYVEGGMYRGLQQLSFHNDNDHARIEHESFYKSNSWLMDMTLYPYFHKMTVGEFHQQFR